MTNWEKLFITHIIDKRSPSSKTPKTDNTEAGMAGVGIPHPSKLQMCLLWA